MKAYVIRNNELELMWSWDDPQAPSSEAPADTLPETSDGSTPNASTSATLENGERGMPGDLQALDHAVRIKQRSDAAVVGAVRQQWEEIQELREQVGRAETETKLWPEQLRKLESRLEELSQRLDAAITSNQGLGEAEVGARKLNENGAAGGGRGSFWKTLTELVLGSVLCGGITLAGWWAYTQRGMIDAFRDPDPLPQLKAKIPVPALTEAPNVGEASSSPAASQGVQVVVTAKEDIWLEAEADGNQVFAKLLLANQTKSFDALRQIKILTGNLAGTSVNYNGRPIGPIGNRRQVGAFTFSLQGWTSRRATM